MNVVNKSGKVNERSGIPNSSGSLWKSQLYHTWIYCTAGAEQEGHPQCMGRPFCISANRFPGQSTQIRSCGPSPDATAITRPSQEALFAAIVLGIVPLEKPFRKSHLLHGRIKFLHAYPKIKRQESCVQRCHGAILLRQTFSCKFYASLHWILCYHQMASHKSQDSTKLIPS